MRRVPIATILTAGLLVAALVAYAFTFQVRFSEVAVKVRLGKADASSVIEQPGIYSRWPWPLESVVKYDKRLQVMDTSENEIKTLDGKNVIVGMSAVWKIKDPLQFYVRVVTKRQAEEQLRARLNEVRAAVIGRYDMSSFVSLDAEQVEANYNKMQSDMLNSAAPGIERDYGVALVDLGITRISLPEGVNQKVFEAMSQERLSEATRYQEEGRAVAAAIRARAEAAARSIKSFTETRAKAQEAEGAQAAARTLELIKTEDRDFFIWMRWMDAMKASLAEKSTIFFDSNSQLFKMFTQPPVLGKDSVEPSDGPGPR